MEDPGIKTDASYSDRTSIKIDINENTRANNCGSSLAINDLKFLLISLYEFKI